MNKQQLANKIWASANKMRSKIDANEYKDYILGLIFYKFLSDNEANYLLKDMKGASDAEKKAALEGLVENYEDENSKVIIDYCRNNIGYFIEYKNLFSTWLLPDSSFTVADLSVALNSFDRLVSPHYKTVYDGIFKTLQAGLSKLGENPASQTRALKDLIKLIKDIPTDGSQDYDVLGYVYEYLIGNFAANAGKKAGEFYTPHEVAILLSEIVAEHHREKRQIEIYDPTSGSGSLLITIGKSVGRHIADKNRVKYYAQELKENTYNLTRMNLVMRGIQPGNINTRCADSLDEDWPVQKEGNEMGQPLYVDSSEAAEQYDIYATMFGGIPNTDFELVQRVKFQAELDAIATLQSRVEAIGGELEEVRDSFTEEEQETYLDSEKDNAPDKKKITADAKPKADVDTDTKAKLRQMVTLWDEQTKWGKQIKADKQALEEKTIQAIEQLTDEEIAGFLHLKWIVPVCEGIHGALTAVLSTLESSALALSRKYAVSYQQIDDDIAAANTELAQLVSQLTGDEFAIKGLEALINKETQL